MKEVDGDVSFKSLFIPFTPLKAILSITIIGLIVYGNSLFNNFLGDDKIYIIDYTPSHTINIANAFGPSIFNTAGQYRPIPALYFSVLYTLFGTHQVFYHILQLSLHIVCAILLFVLLRKFFSLGITFFSVVIFLVHPIQVESVSYISQTVSQLFFLFGILAFLLSLKKKITFRTLIFIGMLLLFSFLTKETGALFFLLIITYRLLFNRKDVIKLSFAGLLSIIVYFLLRYFIGNVGFDTRQLGPIAMASLPERLLTLPAIVFYYLKAIIFPNALAYDQQWVITSIDLFHFYLPLIADVLFLIAICLAGVFLLRTQKRNIKLFSFFCVWFFSGLLMILQIYPLDATVADRWFYFPLVGIIGMIAAFVQSFTKLSPVIRKASTIALICILVLFSIRTVVRNSNWVDAINLFSHDITISENANIDENLAYELLLAHRYQEALLYLQRSIRIAPHASSLYDLGYVYEQLHNYQKAKYYYALSIQKKEKVYGQDEVKKYTYDGMARVVLFHDNPKNAKEFLEEALRKYPEEGSYWAYLAILNYNLGNQEEALNAAKKAKTLLHNPSANLLYYRISNKKPLNLQME